MRSGFRPFPPFNDNFSILVQPAIDLLRLPKTEESDGSIYWLMSGSAPTSNGRWQLQLFVGSPAQFIDPFPFKPGHPKRPTIDALRERYIEVHSQTLNSRRPLSRQI